MRVREFTFNSFSSLKAKLELILSQDTDIATSQVDYEREGSGILCMIRQLYVAQTQTDTAPGLNDGTYAGTYTGTEDSLYEVEIDGDSATPETFKWSRDGVEIATGVDCSTSAVTLADGITISWLATVGHTNGDKWSLWTMIS